MQMEENSTPVTLEQGLADFVDIFMPARNFSVRTREEYTRDLKGLIAFLSGQGIERWEQVGLRELQLYMAELDKRGLQPSSRNRKTHAIKTFFKFLKLEGAIRQNVAASLIPPSVPRQERRFLSEDEYQALLAQVSNVRDRAIIMLFLQTGLRLSELANLQTYDLQLPKRITKNPEDVGMIRVHRKRGKEETLPLNFKACEAVSAYLRERKSVMSQRQLSSDALFISKFGEPMTIRAIRYMVKKYLMQANIRGASVHTLRHTMATHYLARGGDPKSVQTMLGHESIATTEVYVGLAKKVQRKMVQDLAL